MSRQLLISFWEFIYRQLLAETCSLWKPGINCLKTLYIAIAMLYTIEHLDTICIIIHFNYRKTLCWKISVIIKDLKSLEASDCKRLPNVILRTSTTFPVQFVCLRHRLYKSHNINSYLNLLVSEIILLRFVTHACLWSSGWILVVCTI